MLYNDKNKYMKLKIREIRKLKGITIIELAKLTGISKSKISRIERNEDSPTMDHMEFFAIVLNVKINDLFESDVK